MTSHAARNPCGSNKSMTQQDNTVKIRELVDRQVQAWETHDFGIAAPDWLPSGEVISPGGHVPAEEMQTAMADYFKQFRDLLAKSFCRHLHSLIKFPKIGSHVFHDYSTND
jgi:hypothetical protein